MADACKHEVLQQVSEVMLRWGWTRQPDGSYKPDETHNKVLHEETVDFTCADCGKTFSLDEYQRIKDDE